MSKCRHKKVAISPPQSEYISGKKFRIPLTDVWVALWHDNATIQYDCPRCLQDDWEYYERQQYDDVFEAGMEKGYRLAERDLR